MSLQSVIVDAAALVPAGWWDLLPTLLFGSLPMLAWGLVAMEARLQRRTDRGRS